MKLANIIKVLFRDAGLFSSISERRDLTQASSCWKPQCYGRPTVSAHSSRTVTFMITRCQQFRKQSYLLPPSWLKQVRPVRPAVTELIVTNIFKALSQVRLPCYNFRNLVRKQVLNIYHEYHEFTLCHSLGSTLTA